MATIKQLTKQCETSQKRIEDYTKKIEMYKQRCIKACAKFNVNFDEITYTKSGYGFDVTLPIAFENFWDGEKITNNYQYMLENERKLEQEQKYLETLTNELNALIETERAKENAYNNALENAFNSAMVDFKTMWVEKMTDWHDSHYDYVNENKKSAKQTYNRAEHLLFVLTWKYRHHYRFIDKLKNICRNTKSIFTDRAAFLPKEKYMNEVATNLEKTWQSCIKKLVEKCQTYNIDNTKIELSHIAVTSKGFETYITDGKPRRIYARMIWAAEYSQMVSPHTRYIVTEKKIK